MDDPLGPAEHAYKRLNMIALVLLVLLFLTNLIMGFTGGFVCLRSGHPVPRGLRTASKVGAFLPPIGLIFGSICINMNNRR